jgi:hypothetical protein
VRSAITASWHHKVRKTVWAGPRPWLSYQNLRARVRRASFLFLGGRLTAGCASGEVAEHPALIFRTRIADLRHELQDGIKRHVAHPRRPSNRGSLDQRGDDSCPLFSAQLIHNSFIIYLPGQACQEKSAIVLLAMLARACYAVAMRKNRAAQLLGKLGASKGGKARAKALSSEQRKAIAQKAAKARWADKEKPAL